ncbi:restriction endonuclease subunit S [Acidithiobacillus thiooxidans]|uniref:restriction endonuclease subunit S n=1 Tax=Acidithiobacillus thiooxidans TaxID=930 RepID=UPI000262546F|nr:restriction endonuclease subunit S [Acidithiobacillus thiooxidans]MBU2794228.1 restriction endonuclease subunit S [Acidithiobacillus thiooxidans]MBU2812350.1 restriction endonuclease subunit S [Acidithiobacillus thiooxidans]MBU2837756.1 restriction endonuclease subunit S [Acidithiobacillus thiooxidans]
MSGITNNGRVPRLRFPEFRGAEPWKVNRFDEVLSPVVRERPKPAETYLGLGLRSHGKGTFLKLLEDPAKNSMDQLYEVKANDLIVNITFAWEGAVAIAKERDEGALVSHRFPTYTFEKGRTTPGFFRYFILDKQFVYNLGVISPGGAGRNRVMSKNDFMKLQVALPSPAEQQKIAECLSSLDDLITLEAQKLDSLKAHKKGLMQQLFPREGETQPRLRFPEFQNAGEWQTLPLAALADKIMVGIASAATHAYRETGVPMLRNQNIKEGKIDDSSLLFIDPAYEAAHKNKRLRSGDVITVRTGYPGLSAVVTERYHNAQCFTSLITRPKKSLLDAKYLCAFINSEIGKRFVLGAEAGGAQKNVNAGVLEALPVYLPELDEQKRIASCLTSLDDLITAQTQKLEALKTHKKGLMQQLFPQVSEE